MGISNKEKDICNNQIIQIASYLLELLAYLPKIICNVCIVPVCIVNLQSALVTIKIWKSNPMIFREFTTLLQDWFPLVRLRHLAMMLNYYLIICPLFIPSISEEEKQWQVLLIEFIFTTAVFGLLKAFSSRWFIFTWQSFINNNMVGRGENICEEKCGCTGVIKKMRCSL